MPLVELVMARDCVAGSTPPGETEKLREAGDVLTNGAVLMFSLTVTVVVGFDAAAALMAISPV